MQKFVSNCSLIKTMHVITAKVGWNRAIINLDKQLEISYNEAYKKVQQLQQEQEPIPINIIEK